MADRTEAERLWLHKKVSGSTSQTRLGQLRKTYYLSQVTGDPGETLITLQKRWLRKWIADNLGTVTGTGQNLTELWADAVRTLNLTLGPYAVSSDMTENERTFYQNAG